MFKNLNTAPENKPRLLGELGDLSHAKVSASEFKYSKGTEIFGQAEAADYIIKWLKVRFGPTNCYRTAAVRLAHFTCPAIFSASKMAIFIVSQPKLSSTPPFALLDAKASNTWPKPILRWFEAC